MFSRGKLMVQLALNTDTKHLMQKDASHCIIQGSSVRHILPQDSTESYTTKNGSHQEATSSVENPHYSCQSSSEISKAVGSIQTDENQNVIEPISLFVDGETDDPTKEDDSEQEDNFEDLDDSLQDPDYVPDKNETESSDEETIVTSVQSVSHIEDIDHEEVVQHESKKKRRKKRDPSDWNRSRQKQARMQGKLYKGITKIYDGKWQHSKVKSERKLKPRGCSNQCATSKVRQCSKISEEDRERLFSDFWSNLTWEQKKVYITSSVTQSDVKRKTIEGESRKQSSYAYHLVINDCRYSVCKNMFLNTLDIGEKTVYSWKQNTTVAAGLPSSAKVKKSKDQSMVRKTAYDFLEKLPKVESHYCRSTTTKQFVEPFFSTKADLFKAYKENCIEQSIPYCSNCLFYNVFDEMNLSLYVPKKDQCDKCIEHSVGNITEEEHYEHMCKKQEAYDEKARDKSICLEDETRKVIAIDLQAVLLCPKLQASALYYRTKLACHNFTVMDLASKSASCYFWTEVEDLSASSFASCVTDYLTRTLDESPMITEVIIYSDGCTYQNRNVVLSNALLKIAQDRHITIMQKYLERGHTYMEVDAIHSVIERKLRQRNTKIHIPQDYVDILKIVRPGQPFNVQYVDHTFFRDFTKVVFYKTIRPGIKAGYPVVTDLRALRYNEDGTIQYKTRFPNDFQDLPRTSKLHHPQVEDVLLHSARLPIKGSKYKHLQELKKVILADYHAYYDAIPQK